jgi:hypothetical protein
MRWAALSQRMVGGEDDHGLFKTERPPQFFLYL